MCSLLKNKSRKTNRAGKNRKRFAAAATATLAATLLTLLGGARPAEAFGGEDPINGNPWHHADISYKAAMKDGMGWAPGAAEAIAWHADYVDSYLYNPLWWAPGGLSRFKASLSTAGELEKVHFDDLFSSDQVRYMWRRYLSGTVAGLLWAKQNNDVSAAQNIVGVSLHAIQDFYSHSNWVDAPERRNHTFLQEPLDRRAALTLYTGSYEQPDQLNIKSHGKYAPAASIMMQPGVKQLLDLASSGLSPLQNTPMMTQYRALKANNPTSVQPYVPYGVDAGIKVPASVVYLAPPGIALDNTWLSQIGVKQRGLTDMTGDQAFSTAKGLAIEQTAQWLKRLDSAMHTAGADDFWTKVKQTPVDKDERTKQYEKFNNFPYTFVSAGQYPPPSDAVRSTAEEYYLRINLKTSGDAFAGTNADIYLNADGKDQLLDYMPRAVPGLAHDDFEAGDDEVYIAGPFAQLPSRITLRNDSGGIGSALDALGRTFTAAGDKIKDVALSIIGGHADLVGTRKQIWMPADLARITTQGEQFLLNIDGGDQGYYRIVCTIRKTGETNTGSLDDTHSFHIEIVRLECIRESKSDRGSNSDEPFLLMLLSALPGNVQAQKTPPMKDVDKGERFPIDCAFDATVNKKYGVLNLPICAMESDDESEKDRQELLDKFAGQVKEETADETRGFLASLDSARAADWKLQQIKVYAWTKNGAIRGGEVLNQTCNKWIGGGETAAFPLNAAAIVNSGVTTDSLLAVDGTPPSNNPGQNTPPTPGTDPSTTPPGTPWPGTGQTAPPPPGVGTGPSTPVGNGNASALLNGLKGTWLTNYGATLTIDQAVTTAGTPVTLHGKAKNGGNSLEDFYLRDESGSVQGLYTAMPGANLATDWSSFGIVTFTALSADGNSFTAKVVLKNGNSFAYTGTRVNGGGTGTNTSPGTTGNTGNNVGDSGSTNNGSSNGNTGIVPPPPGMGRPGDGRFNALEAFDFKLDDVRMGRGSTLELFATIRAARDNVGIRAESFNMVITDEDGVGIRNTGNLYRAGGDDPVKIDGTVWLSKGETARIRYIFELPKGMTALKKLKVLEYRESCSYDLSQVRLTPQ